MSRPLPVTPIRITFDETVPEPAPIPQPCASCAAQTRELKRLRRQTADLTAQNARLIRAVQRESHHLDVRAPHDGKRYIERNK